MRLEDLKFLPRPNLGSSEHALLIARKTEGGDERHVFVCEARRTGCVIEFSEQGEDFSPVGYEFAPIPTAPPYLPRVETPEEGKRYILSLNACPSDEFVAVLRDGEWYSPWKGSAPFDKSAYTAYGPLPPREPEPEPLEDCMAVSPGGNYCPGKCRGDVLVSVGGVDVKFNANWRIAREWQHVPAAVESEAAQ